MKELRLRLIGSGYTDEECDIYGLENLANPDAASNFISNDLFRRIFRPAVNNSAQQHLLEDKWVSQLYFQSIGVHMPSLVGLYHPNFGTTGSGALLRTIAQLEEALRPLLPAKLIFKPRGGRLGHNIVSAEFAQTVDGTVLVTCNDTTVPLPDFIEHLPADAFGDFDGGYAGWLVPIFCSAASVHARAGTLRSEHVPRGGNWVSKHPDSGVTFEGRTIPMWDSVRELCCRAARGVSGIRSVGWDVALTRDGPTILEGNANWGLPLVQIHTQGFLTPEVRADLAALGVTFPSRLKALLARRRWQLRGVCRRADHH